LEAPEKLTLRFSLVMISALLWVGIGLANQQLLDWAHHSVGIDLVYLPAGVRLLIVLVFGVWGAAGITLANPMMALFEFGPEPIIELLLNSMIAGFVPWLGVMGCCKIIGVDPRLSKLRPIHIPMLALGVSVATPLAFNLQFVMSGLKQPQDFTANLSAMILGDFVGCLLVLIMARLAIALYRKAIVKS